jgi:hypothetical protein
VFVNPSVRSGWRKFPSSRSAHYMGKLLRRGDGNIMADQVVVPSVDTASQCVRQARIWR